MSVLVLRPQEAREIRELPRWIVKQEQSPDLSCKNLTGDAGGCRVIPTHSESKVTTAARNLSWPLRQIPRADAQKVM